MGIRLVLEAAAHHPATLTWRESRTLLVLAASAMDATRECPPGIERNADITERLRLSRTQLYLVLDALCVKGALVRLERGRNGVQAVYAIAPFSTTTGPGRPGDPDVPPVDEPAEPVVDNPPKGPGSRDASGGAKGPGSDNEGSRFDPSKGPGSRDASRRDTVFRGIKGFKTGGETPLPPQRPLFPAAVQNDPPEEGEFPEGGKPAPERDTRGLAAEIRRTRPDWSARSIIRALEKPAVAERPWPLACEAIRIIAADPLTQHPGRLEHDGPWWAEAARRTADRTPGRPPWCGACDELTRTVVDSPTQGLVIGEDRPKPCSACHPSKARSA